MNNPSVKRQPESHVFDARQAKMLQQVSQDYLCRIFIRTESDFPRIQYQWEHRASPSGGGRHPINIVVLNLIGREQEILLYDSLTHSLSELGDINAEDLRGFVSAVDEVLPLNGACILWFIAQFDKTLSKYEGGDSLVWQDAGCLLSTTYLVAEALDFNCCAIGITGEPYISEMLSAAPLVEGVGGCLIWKK